MESARRRVGAAAELAACVKLGEDDLNAGQAGLWFFVHRHTTTIVPNLHGAIGEQVHLNVLAPASQRLIDGVVEDLPQAVHEAPTVRGADVHARPLAHSIEALEHS